MSTNQDENSKVKDAPSLDIDSHQRHLLEQEQVQCVVEDQDEGVTRMEALYIVFGKGWKWWLLWASIGLIAYTFSLAQTTTGVYLQFATSAFASHATLGTIAVITNLVSAIAQPVIAKLCDLFSRPSAYASTIVFYLVGSILIAASHTVEEVAAGQVIAQVGTTGIGMITTLIVSDMTSLQNRGLVNSIKDSPFIVNAFIAGYITTGISAFSENGWRWGYGMFIILVPACIGPALAVFFWADRKAKRTGALSLASPAYARQQVLKGTAPEQTRWELIIYYFHRTDLIGLILLASAFGLLLVPATISTRLEGGYSNPTVIAMYVVGGVLLFVFAGWEWRIAKHPIMPSRVFNRSLICACLIEFFVFLAATVANTFLYSWVYVIKDWSDRNYTFFTNTTTVGGCIFAVIAGALLKYTHRYKWVQIVGLCFRVISSGLVFYASRDPSDAVLVTSQIIDSAGTGFAILGSLLAAQASVPHQDTALAIALINLTAALGGAIGSAIGASIWTRRLPEALESSLGGVLDPLSIAEIYGSIVVARLSEPRDLVISAYLEAGRSLYLVSMILTFIPLIPGFLTSNFYLDSRHNAIESKEVVLRSEEETDEETIRGKAREAERQARRDLGLVGSDGRDER